jgi:hypothetical protein
VTRIGLIAFVRLRTSAPDALADLDGLNKRRRLRNNEAEPGALLKNGKHLQLAASIGEAEPLTPL